MSQPPAAGADTTYQATNWRDGLACALLLVLAVFIIHPAAEMAFVDEWSYVRSSLIFARSGRIAYYGASAMVGWQIPWGALFFKLFGFSFRIARLSMLPFAAGAVWLMQACLRQFGIARAGAILGALTLGLSPLFLPLASSYMTDGGALFGVLLCLFLCQRAIVALSAAASVRWLCAAALGNLLLGTDRQIVWLGVLVMVPGTAWLLRRRRGVVPAAAFLWLVSLVQILAAMHWFGHQNNILPARLFGPITPAKLASMVWELGVRLQLCLLLLVLPVALAGLARLASLGRAALLRTAALSFALLAGSILLIHLGHTEGTLMPWEHPMIANLGMNRVNDELPGVREVTLGLWPRALLSLLVFAALAATLEWTFASRKHTPAPPPSQVPLVESWAALFWTIGLYTLAYLALLVPTQLFGSGFYDRYALFLMPCALAVLLKLYTQRLGIQSSRRADSRLGHRWPNLCYATLALFAAYTVMATHDWFALLRARVALANHLQAGGLPRTSILGGWEYDAWTQMEAQDFLNYAQAIRPPGQTYASPPERKRPCERGIVDWTPAIDPKVAIVYSSIPCFAPSIFPRAEYRAWLPPFTRHLTVQRIPGD